MADVIDFLERMGQDAGLRHASNGVLEEVLRATQLNSRARAALMSGDRAEIEAVVGTESNVCCMVWMPGDEEQQPREGKPRKAA